MNATDVTLGHQVREILVRRQPAVREEDHVLEAGGFGFLVHLPGLLRVGRERLLAHDVQASIQRRHRHREVQVIRRGDDDGIQSGLCEHRTVVVVDLRDVVLFCERGGARWVAPADGSQRCAWMTFQVRQQAAIRPPTRPDHADTHALRHYCDSSTRFKLAKCSTLFCLM